MEKEHEFEQCARDALDKARQSIDVPTRAHWLNIASHYLELAKEHAGKGQKPSDGRPSGGVPDA
jgi:hypothetical protein